MVLSGAHALVITGRDSLGLYKGNPIYRVTAMKVLSCNNNLLQATPEEVQFRTLQTILQPIHIHFQPSC